jgi:uncharacterized protein (DUF427 family)
MWNGVVLAESDETIVVEGNHYFPPESIDMDYFRQSAGHSTCPWKGRAGYYDVVVNGQVNPGAAWFYPDPKHAARQIGGYIAFWRGVRVDG